MEIFMKCMGEAKMEQLKKLGELAVDFGGIVKDVAEKSAEAGTNLTSLIDTVGELLESQSANISSLTEEASKFRQIVQELKRKIEDLASNLNDAKAIIDTNEEENGKKKGKPGKPEEIVLKFATIVDIALGMAEQFLISVGELESIILAIEENRWEDVKNHLANITTCLEEALNCIQEMNEITSAEKKDKKPKRDKKKDKDENQNEKKEIKPKNRNVAVDGNADEKEKSPKEDEDEDLGSCRCF